MKPETIGQRVAGVHLPIRSEKQAEDLREAHGLPRKLETKPAKDSSEKHPAADETTGTKAGSRKEE